MSKHKWEVGPVKLVNGCDAIIHRFCEKRQQYIGEVQDTLGRWFAKEWNDRGQYYYGIGECDMLNLAQPPKKTMRFKRFIRLCNNGDWYSFLTEEQARAKTGKDTFAMFVIDREVEEGEGL